MDCCVKGALEKSPLTSAFPSFQTIRHRRRLLFIPFLLLSCLRDAPSKGALCLKEILSSILSACSRIARSNDFIARPKTPGLQTLGIFGIYLRDFRWKFVTSLISVQLLICPLYNEAPSYIWDFWERRLFVRSNPKLAEILKVG